MTKLHRKFAQSSDERLSQCGLVVADSVAEWPYSYSIPNYLHRFMLFHATRVVKVIPHDVTVGGCD